VSLRISAVRGDSWVLIRSGGAGGPLVYVGVIRIGKSVSVTGWRLWARFGALGNLDLRVNGRSVRPNHSGTVDAYVTSTGLSR